MRIAIAMVQVPFYTGGAEIHANMLCDELKKRGHQAEVVTIPFKWYPASTLEDCMVEGMLMDLTKVNGERIDLVIAMKFPAIYCKANCKVLWLLHQHRQAYDLYGTKYSDMNESDELRRVREEIIKADTKYISEADAVFTNAQNTADRLLKYNGIEGKALYHPPLNYEKLECKGYEDFIFYPSRIDAIKRQRVLVEAARYTKSPVKMIIAGGGSQTEIEYLKNYIAEYKLEDKVVLAGFISEEEKIDYYARCLGVYFGAYNEDYGYITLEGFYSKKPVIVHEDAGGPLEFVENGVNGFVIPEDAKEVAAKIDALYDDKEYAKKLGEAGFDSLIEKNINWDHVIDSLLEAAVK